MKMTGLQAHNRIIEINTEVVTLSKLIEQEKNELASVTDTEERNRRTSEVALLEKTLSKIQSEKTKITAELEKLTFHLL